MVKLNTRSLFLFKFEAAWSSERKKATPFIVYAKSAAVQSFYTDNRDEISAAELQFSADICTISGLCTHLPTGTHTDTHTNTHTHILSNLIVPEKTECEIVISVEQLVAILQFNLYSSTPLELPWLDIKYNHYRQERWTSGWKGRQRSEWRQREKNSWKKGKSTVIHCRMHSGRKTENDRFEHQLGADMGTG